MIFKRSFFKVTLRSILPIIQNHVPIVGKKITKLQSKNSVCSQYYLRQYKEKTEQNTFNSILRQ